MLIKKKTWCGQLMSPSASDIKCLDVNNFPVVGHGASKPGISRVNGLGQ